MHIKVRSRGSHFGMHWDPANVALTLMLVLLFLIFLLIFISLTARPALGQTCQAAAGSGCRGMGCGVVFAITP